MKTDVRFEFEHALEGEDVGDDLAFPCVVDATTGVEQSAVDGHERVVEVALQGSVAVGVDDLEGVRVGDRDVIWSEPNEVSCKTGPMEAQWSVPGSWMDWRCAVALVGRG